MGLLKIKTKSKRKFLISTIIKKTSLTASLPLNYSLCRLYCTSYTDITWNSRISWNGRSHHDMVT